MTQKRFRKTWESTLDESPNRIEDFGSMQETEPPMGDTSHYDEAQTNKNIKKLRFERSNIYLSKPQHNRIRSFFILKENCCTKNTSFSEAFC